ncbi:MAG: hypothetical protein M5U12_09370 [Verrucomicrobia bacterium]|nr:hypothetical protein [Verrucomicrobiota bacterium]
MIAAFFRLSSALLTAGFLLAPAWIGAGEIRPAADAPQPLSPEDSAQRFQLPPGFRIECVASEPLVADPTDAAFDAHGRLFVCELHGYNLEGHYDIQELNRTGVLDTQVRRIPANPEALARAERESHGTVKLLEDTDGDGRMDRLTVWANDLPPCYGIVPAREGVIVLCAPHIVYLGDPDGDRRPEIRETLFTGFGVGEMWTRISNPQWGVDNWIYAACGEGSDGTIHGPRLPAPVRIGRTGFRFKPDGSRFEPVSGGTAGFGLALDDWDERFLVTNQEHALQVAPLPYHYLARNLHSPTPPLVNNIGTYGHPARVYPTAPPDPWRLQRSLQPEWVKFYGAAETTMGLITAACAPFIYRADAFPPEYRGAHFSCECAYNLIHLCRLEPAGASFKAVRALPDREFLTSAEQWFRPVNLTDGPDGALYIVDMYREIIEDYSAIPRYLQQQYGLIHGADRGRIWRVVYAPENSPRPVPIRLDQPLALAPTTALVNELASGNAWRRLTAQRLLLERDDRSAIAALTRLLRDRPTPTARLHALHTLAGFAALDPNHLALCLDDAHPGVRRHALALAEPQFDRDPALLARVLTLTRDPSPAVRLQLAFTLGETHVPQRLTALAELAAQAGGDPWMQAALLSSVPNDAGELLRNLFAESRLAGQSQHLVRPLAAVIGSRQHPPELAACLRLLADPHRNSSRRGPNRCAHGPRRGLASRQDTGLCRPRRARRAGPTPGPNHARHASPCTPGRRPAPGHRRAGDHRPVPRGCPRSPGHRTHPRTARRCPRTSGPRPVLPPRTRRAPTPRRQSTSRPPTRHLQRPHPRGRSGCRPLTVGRLEPLLAPGPSRRPRRPLPTTGPLESPVDRHRAKVHPRTRIRRRTAQSVAHQPRRRHPPPR